MDIIISELDAVINSIDFEKSCIKSSFEDFSGDLVLHGKLSCRPIFNGVMTIADALWDIETTIYRLEWQKQLYFHNEISSDQWFIFSKADIRLFHIEIRSLMDHIGLVIKHTAQSKNKTKDSFDELRKKRDHYLQRNMITQEVYDLLDSSDWFDRFRRIRDAIVHEGANVISFGLKKGDPVLWAIYKQRYKALFNDSKFVINENGVMNFERYAAYHTYHIYLFLDKFGDFLYQVTALTRSQKRSAARSHGGIKVLQTWMKELRNYLQAS